MGCNCGKPKCDGKCGISPAVLQINNPSECIFFHRVEVPASMGDSKTNPPKNGAYKNVLLYYEADQTSWFYSSDGIPTKLVSGVQDYEAAINLPQINGETLIGDKTGEELGLQDKLTAGDNISIEDNVISAVDTTYGPATDSQIGLVKPGDGLSVSSDGTLTVIDHVFDTVADMKASTELKNGDYAQTLGFQTINDGGGATYYITDSGTADEMQVIAVGDLFANLVLPTVLTPEMLGATGVGDETTILNKCFAISKNIRFGNDYTITSLISILSGTTLDGANHKITNNTAINCFRAVEQNDIVVKNLEILGDNTVSEAQIGLKFVECNRIVVENVNIHSTGGDGVAFSDCYDCVLRNAKLSDNLISAFAFNSYRITFENIDVYKPRFQYGIQFKSCNDSTMRNIFIDTPTDVGVFISQGNEDYANTTANILCEDIKVINQGQDGTVTETGVKAGICMVNGSNYILNNATVTNGTNNGIDIRSYDTVVSNCVIKNNTLIGLNINTSSGVTVTNCRIIENSFSGITNNVNNVIISNNFLKDNSDNSSRGNITLTTCDNLSITGNTLIVTENSSAYNNIRNTGTLTHSRITDNNFVMEKSGTSYDDYRGSYDFSTGVFANNGLTRLHQVRGSNTILGYATIMNGNITFHGLRDSAPTYTDFSTGDIITNNSGTGYIGWVYNGTAWKGFGAIEA